MYDVKAMDLSVILYFLAEQRLKSRKSAKELIPFPPNKSFKSQIIEDKQTS